MNTYFTKRHAGFTLVEMAIVLVILGFVLSALLLPLQAQREQVFQAQTKATLESARQALLGFAQRNGRLPCPATNNGTATFPDDTGVANPNASGPCQVVGFLPAATLGIQPTDAQGFALDGWNNRIRYAITNANTNAFTTDNAMSNLGLAVLTPDLRACNSATGITATTCSAAPEVNYSINNAVAMIYSTGATFAQGSGGVDEDANLNADGVFVSHDATAASAANGEFDHLVVWISPYVLYNAMIQAGQLH